MRKQRIANAGSQLDHFWVLLKPRGLWLAITDIRCMTKAMEFDINALNCCIPASGLSRTLNDAQMNSLWSVHVIKAFAYKPVLQRNIFNYTTLHQQNL